MVTMKGDHTSISIVVKGCHVDHKLTLVLLRRGCRQEHGNCQGMGPPGADQRISK
jgi:hypothetical protein